MRPSHGHCAAGRRRSGRRRTLRERDSARELEANRQINSECGGVAPRRSAAAPAWTGSQLALGLSGAAGLQKRLSFFFIFSFTQRDSYCKTGNPVLSPRLGKAKHSRYSEKIYEIHGAALHTDLLSRTRAKLRTAFHVHQNLSDAPRPCTFLDEQESVPVETGA